MTFHKAIVALKTGPNAELFGVFLAELERRKQNAMAYLVQTDGTDFARYQGAYRVLEELIADVNGAEQIASLPLDNRRPRPKAA